MARQHESVFGYNLSRPYPFRWFTWVAVIGGLAATALFSVINIGANGYVLKTVYTTNPNATLEQKMWFENAPWSWIGPLKASCEPQNLAIGSIWFTTNMGLSYELTSLSYTPLDTQTSTYKPAIPYLNNTLHNCTVNQIDVHAARTSNAQKYDVPWIWGNTWATAEASCTFDHVVPPVQAVFRASYSNPMVPVTQFATLNNRSDSAQSDSAQWWGSLAMDNGLKATKSFLGTRYPIGDLSYPNWTWSSGSFNLQPNSSATNDITSSSFLSIFGTINFDLFPAPRSGQSIMTSFVDDWDHHPVDAVTFNQELANTLDGFAKSFYASIMHDLGPQNAQPSPLISETIIEYLLQRPNRTDEFRYMNDDGTWRNATEDKDRAWHKDTEDRDGEIDINDYYAYAKDTVAPLRQKPAQLYAQYACSLPKQKERGSLIVSVIVSNLVFLSASWRLLNWIAAGIVAAGDGKETMNWCPGCLDRAGSVVLVHQKADSGDFGASQRLISP